MGRWEWIIVELLVLGALVAELVSVKRSIRRDRLAERELSAEAGPGSLPPGAAGSNQGRQRRPPAEDSCP